MHYDHDQFIFPPHEKVFEHSGVLYSKVLAWEIDKTLQESYTATADTLRGKNILDHAVGNTLSMMSQKKISPEQVLAADSLESIKAVANSQIEIRELCRKWQALFQDNQKMVMVNGRSVPAHLVV